jgi:hypothetical protein
MRLYDLLFNDYGSHCAETNRKSCLKPPEASPGSVVDDPLPSRRKSLLFAGNQLLAPSARSLEGDGVCGREIGVIVGSVGG